MPQRRFADVRRFDSIYSTNRYLLDEARAGAPAGVVAVAALVEDRHAVLAVGQVGPVQRRHFVHSLLFRRLTLCRALDLAEGR